MCWVTSVMSVSVQLYGLEPARLLCPWDSPGKNIAVPSSRGSSQPRDQTHVSYIYLHWQVGSLPLVPPGKPRWSMFSLVSGSQTEACIRIPRRTCWNPHCWSPYSDSVDLGWGPRICISDKFPDDAIVPEVQGPHFENHEARSRGVDLEAGEVCAKTWRGGKATIV